LKAIQSTSEKEATGILGLTMSAIHEGGYDDLALSAGKLAGLIRQQSSLSSDKAVSALVRPLMAVAAILASDKQYLHEAISAYVEAARHTAGKDEELNRQAIICILDKAELLPTSADRIDAYEMALREAPASSQIAKQAIHKAAEQKDPAYFKLRTPTEKPVLEESVIEGDLKVVAGGGIRMVVRHQAPTGVIYYSLVVTRGFSREVLTLAGIQNAQELVRTKVDDRLDRILIPENKLAAQTRRDIDFMLRLRNYGIYVDPVNGRSRDKSGMVSGYKITDGANPDRMRYMGIDAHSITPHDGKIDVPIERIKIHADPALIGKWSWVPTESGAMKSFVPPNECAAVVLSLQTHGIVPREYDIGAEEKKYLVVAKNEKGRLKNIIQQYILQERSKNLLNFAETLPSFANEIAVAAYKDACEFIFGLRNSR
jgi:hypothetical protein